MSMILRQGDRVGPAFLKFYVPGDRFVWLRFWPIWSAWWWGDVLHGRRYKYLSWPPHDIRLSFTVGIVFGFPVWYWPSKVTRCVDRFGNKRGPCLRVIRGGFRIWPFWMPVKVYPRMWECETLAYPIGEQEYLSDDDYFRHRYAMDDIR